MPEADIDVEINDSEESEEEVEGTEQEEFTPPTKDEWIKTQDALKKANEQAKKYRLAAKNAGKKTDESSDGDVDAKAEAKASEVWKPRLIKTAAKLAFAEAGAKNPARLIKMLDVNDLEVDDDGDVDGLEDQIDSLKDEFPELFNQPAEERPRKRPGRVDAGTGGGSNTTKKSATERQAEGLFGKTK
jgi:hypothetical protein